MRFKWDFIAVRVKKSRLGRCKHTLKILAYANDRSIFQGRTHVTIRDDIIDGLKLIIPENDNRSRVEDWIGHATGRNSW